MPAFHARGVTQGALIQRLAAERPTRDALVYPDRARRLTFADLSERTMALARGLAALAIEPGDRVVVWSDNHPDWIPFQFALAQLGAILVTANTALTLPEIRYVLEQCGARAVVAAPAYRPILTELHGELPQLEHWIELGSEGEAGPLSVPELVRRGESVPREDVERATARTAPDDATNIQYTSGTTGFPKGVVLTHRNLLENASTIAELLGTRDDDKLLLQVPLFHCFGCSVSVLGAYARGIPLVATQTFDPERSLRAIAEEGCTLIHGVPTMFLALLSHPSFEELRPTTLRAGVMGGAMCPEALMRRVVGEMGCTGMLVGYGLTEASPGVTMSAVDDPLDVRCGTVGRALPGVEIRVVDPETGEERARGASGELWARGPNVMLGYFANDPATAEVLTDDGWLRTGDLATLDDEGLVRIVGRIKEMIIRGGENVYPAEVEDALRAHPEVRDVAVFALEDERLGETVAAAIVRAPESDLDEAAIAAFLETRLAPFKRPERVAFVEGFPLTPSGKVQRFRLAAHCGFS